MTELLWFWACLWIKDKTTTETELGAFHLWKQGNHKICTFNIWVTIRSPLCSHVSPFISWQSYYQSGSYGQSLRSCADWSVIWGSVQWHEVYRTSDLVRHFVGFSRYCPSQSKSAKLVQKNWQWLLHADVETYRFTWKWDQINIEGLFLCQLRIQFNVSMNWNRGCCLLVCHEKFVELHFTVHGYKESLLWHVYGSDLNESKYDQAQIPWAVPPFFWVFVQLSACTNALQHCYINDHVASIDRQSVDLVNGCAQQFEERFDL